MDTIIFILNCKEAHARNQERELAKQREQAKKHPGRGMATLAAILAITTASSW